MDIVNRITNLPADFMHSFWYILTFFLVWVEWIPPIWVLSPGQFVMLFGWFLSKLWVLNIFIFILVGFFWSVLWDLVWYFIWKKLWLPFLKKYWKYVFIKEDLLEKTKGMLNKHLFKAIFFSRFYGWTRAITPFAAWVSHINLRKYFIYTLLSCFSWSIFWWVIWYVFWQSYELVSQYIWEFMFFAIALSVFMVFAYKYINKKRHIFNREYLYTLLTNILSVFIIAKLADEIAWHTSIVRIDNIINFKINLLANPILDNIMFTINNVGNLYVMLWLSVLFLIYLIYKKKKYYCWLFLFWNLWWFFIDIFMKIFIGRLRPDNALIFLQDYSFPSGHAAMSTILFLSLWIIFEWDMKNKYKQYWFFILCFVPIIVIWFSRIYLNVHWFSDVIWWFFLWVFWITFMVLVLKFIMSNKMDKDMINIP